MDSCILTSHYPVSVPFGVASAQAVRPSARMVMTTIPAAVTHPAVFLTLSGRSLISATKSLETFTFGLYGAAEKKLEFYFIL